MRPPRYVYAYATTDADRIEIWVGPDLEGGVADRPIRLAIGADDDEWDPEAADLTIEDAKAMIDLLTLAIATAEKMSPVVQPEPRRGGLRPGGWDTLLGQTGGTFTTNDNGHP